MNFCNACYKCKYCADSVMGAQSCCNYPGNCTDPIFNYDKNNKNAKNHEELHIKGDKYGVLNGWFGWPVNFDPVWLENCDGFTPKESDN